MSVVQYMQDAHVLSPEIHDSHVVFRHA